MIVNLIRSCFDEVHNNYVIPLELCNVLVILQPDDSVEPYFDSLLDQTDVNNTFSMALCGTVDTNQSTDVSIGGSLVSQDYMACSLPHAHIIILRLQGIQFLKP